MGGVTVGDVTSFLGQLIPVVLGIGVLYVGLRKWIRKVAASSEAAASQLTGTPGTTTVAEDVRAISRSLGEMSGRLDVQERVGVENRERSIRAETLATSAHDRLDKHLANDHGFHITPKEN